MTCKSSIYYHFISWPSSVTLTFSLSGEMFQMALLLFKENNCAKLFWNPYINVEVMVRTSSIFDHFIIWPSSVTLIFNLSWEMFQQLCQIILKFIYKCRSYGPDKLNLWPFYHLTFKSDLDFQPTQTNISNCTSTSQGDQLCQTILKYMHNCRSYGPDKCGQTHNAHTLKL